MSSILEQGFAIMDLLLQTVLGCLERSTWSLSFLPPAGSISSTETEIAVGLSVQVCVLLRSVCVCVGAGGGMEKEHQWGSETDRCVPTISLQLHWHFNDTSSSVH